MLDATPDPLPPAFLAALRARLPSANARSVLDAPALEVALGDTLSSTDRGETLTVPAVPPLDLFDEPGWRGYVHRLLASPRPSGEAWRQRLDEDEARPVLALQPGEIPGSPFLTRVLGANVSADPHPGKPAFMTAGMQEALVGLLIAQHVLLDLSTLGEAAQCANPRLLTRVLAALDHRHGTRLSLAGSGLLDHGAAGGLSLLHLAVRNRSSGLPSVLDQLLERGAPFELFSNAGVSPLGETVTRSNLPATRALLQRGADVNSGGSGLLPPLFSAIDQDDAPMVTLLLAAGARTVRPNGATAMARATIMPAPAIAALQALLDHGVEPFPRTVPGDPNAPRNTSLLDHTRQAQVDRPADKRLLALNLLEQILLRQTLDDEGVDPQPSMKGRVRL